MKIDATTRIADLASALPESTQVFESLGLDYSFAGTRSIADAAYAEGLDPLMVIARLRRLDSAREAESWSDRPLKQLTAHLVNEQHRFVHDDMARIALKLADLCSAADAAPGLRLLRKAFAALSQVLLPHLQAEERTAFPYVESVEESWQSAAPRGTSPRSVRSMIVALMGDHRAIAEQLALIRRTRLGLQDEGDLPIATREALEAIARLESRLHEFLFLENCVLYPRAVAMAEQLMELETVTVTA